MADCEPIISDHAVIRFLERAYGLRDFITEVRSEIARGVEPAMDFGAPVAIVHGCRMVIVDGHRVVTALPKPNCARDRTKAYRGRGKT